MEMRGGDGGGVTTIKTIFHGNQLPAATGVII